MNVSSIPAPAQTQAATSASGRERAPNGDARDNMAFAQCMAQEQALFANPMPESTPPESDTASRRPLKQAHQAGVDPSAADALLPLLEQPGQTIHAAYVVTAQPATADASPSTSGRPLLTMNLLVPGRDDPADSEWPAWEPQATAPDEASRFAGSRLTERVPVILPTAGEHHFPAKPAPQADDRSPLEKSHNNTGSPAFVLSAERPSQPMLDRGSFQATSITSGSTQTLTARSASELPGWTPTDGAFNMATSMATPLRSESLGYSANGQILTSFGQNHWPMEFQQNMVRLVTQASEGSHRVQLQLNPAELGPVRIHLEMQDGTAQIVFFASHAPVRQALETALPQLQSQLAQAGIHLGQADVSDQSAQDHHRSGNSDAEPLASTHHAAKSGEARALSLQHGQPSPAIAQRILRLQGLVDTYV